MNQWADDPMTRSPDGLIAWHGPGVDNNWTLY
jgi:hypothetical protein